MTIRYQVFPFDLGANRYTVVCHIPNPRKRGQRVSLPAWLPGSYKIRDFAKHVSEISADCNGREISFVKIDKQTWEAGLCNGPLTITYIVYAVDRSVRGAYLDMEYGFFNGSALFVEVEGQSHLSAEIEIYRPLIEHTRTWRIATALKRVGDLPNGFGRYLADTYEELIDSPVLLGDIKEVNTFAFGIPHTMALIGAPANIDLNRLGADIKRICETEMAFFDHPYPTPKYTFLVLVRSEGLGGLEHSHSSALQCGRNNLPLQEHSTNAMYVAFLRLISHEYFHLWHVKRIRPEAIVESNLKEEAYTRQLWIFEGLTSYYEDLLLLRAGIINRLDYLYLLSRNITDLLKSAGRHRQTITESSFDAWIKYYQLQEVSPHSVVSYYTKGAMIGLMLDLWIRYKTLGKKSLDNIMRALWQTFGLTRIPLKEGEFETLADTVTGIRVKRFLKDWLYSTNELPLQKLLQKFGIGWTEHFTSTSVLGIQVRENNGGLEVVALDDHGPAQNVGIMLKDNLIALNGNRATLKQWQQLHESSNYGEMVVITFFRDELLRQVSVTFEEPQLSSINLRIERPLKSKKINQLQEGWLASGHLEHHLDMS